jgi:hypothetical protein
MRKSLAKPLVILAACVTLFASAASTAFATTTYTVGGTLSGLKSGDTLTLLNNGKDALKLKANGTFAFKTALASKAGYDVTVGTQPVGQVCAVTGAKGTVAAADIKSVLVKCVSEFTIGGKVSGLAAKAEVILLDDSGNPLPVKANGTFTFTKVLLTGATYKVTVGTEPAGETCVVTGGTGKVASANIKTVVVTCKLKPYTIGGNVTGLASGDSVILLDNKTNALTVKGNGAFTFTKDLTIGSAYAVTVGTEPAGETCTVTKGTGKVATADIKTVVVACKAIPSYTIGGNVSGLSSGTSVTLLDNTSDSVTVSSNTTFAFAKALASGTMYKVTVGTLPTGETCAIANGSGTVAAANIINVAVSCTPIATTTYTIGGGVTGLNSGTSVTLLDNTTDSVKVSSNTTFAFPTALASGKPYSVTVGTQPTGETCSITNGSGTVAAANITNVAVSCTTSGGGGGGGGFWIPYKAMPEPKVMGGMTGMFVIPSGSLDPAPMPSWITMASPQSLALGVDATFSNGDLAGYTPALIIYAATDSGGNTHVYGLDLTASADAPTPVQISNLSVPSTQQICGGDGVPTNFADPTTTFVLLEIAPLNLCGGTSSTFVVVHYKDSASTTPVPVTISDNNFDTLYDNSTLTGLIHFDFNTGNVLLFADDTFTSPKTLFTGADFTESEDNSTTKENGTSNLFYAVDRTTDMVSVETLYRIDSSGNSTQIFVGPIGSNVSDDTNFYFVSTTGNQPPATNTSTIYQVPLAGGTPQALYVGPAVNAMSQGLDYELTGSNGSVLIYSVTSTKGTTLYNVPIGTTTTSPTSIAEYAGDVLPFLGTPLNGDPSSEVLFVSNRVPTVTMSGVTYAWSSIAFPSGGPYTGTPLANSAYEDLGELATKLSGVTWRVKGITDTGGGVGGSNVYQTDIETLVDTAMTTTGGGNYTVPTGYIGIIEGISTAGIAIGDFLPEFATTPQPSLGVAVDTTKKFLLPLQLSNTDVEVFF